MKLLGEFKDVTTVILAGGLGTRLGSLIKNKPKVLVKIKDHPFLEYLLHQLDQAGLKKVVLCTGYLGDQIEKTFGQRYKNLHLYYSRELTPLGTAGSLRYSLHHISSKTVLAMNGDSFCDVDFKKFWQFHVSKKTKASLVLAKISDAKQSGNVKLRRNDSVVQFQEKTRKGPGLVNAGIYLIDKTLIKEIPEGKLSLEMDIFPTWIGRGFYGYGVDSFIDIGTPESLQRAQQFFAQYTI